MSVSNSRLHLYDQTEKSNSRIFVIAGHGCISAASSWDSRLFCDESPARSVQMQLGNVLVQRSARLVPRVCVPGLPRALVPGGVRMVAVERDGDGC